MLLPLLLQAFDSAEEKLKFETFYVTYSDFVMYLSLEKLKDYHLAEENAQEVFLTLARNFGRIKEVVSEETKGFVYVVTNAMAISKFRKEILHSPEKEENVDVDTLPDETLDLLNAAVIKLSIESLSEDERTILRLKYQYGFTSGEIGAMLRESSSNVRKKLQIIRKKLKERLDDER